MAESPPETPVSRPPPPAVNPMSLSIEETARMLSAGGGRRVTPEDVRADIEAGAPLTRDGRINLVEYAAWLVREVQAG